MRRVGSLWPQVVSFTNLYSAYRKARRGKGDRPEVVGFELDLERNLLDLQSELIEQRYRPGEYRLFRIYDRKPRTIAAAPFRDRVVHHALMALVEPVLDRRMIDDSYACRKGRGVHAAVVRYQRWAQRYAYALKVDVQAYFPSVDHTILKETLRRHLKDPGVLWLFDRIIDSAPESPAPVVFFPGDDLVDLMRRRRGLPIGNLTSQFLGNLYLNGVDHYLKERCGARAYLRYVDDLILLDDDKERLWALRAALDQQLARIRLRLHPNKVRVQSTALGLDVLGYWVFPQYRRLRRDAGYRYRRRLRELARLYGEGRIDLEDVRASVAAWIGHARNADSGGLRRAVLGSVCFRRGCGRDSIPGRGSRRLVEQRTEEPARGRAQQEPDR